MHICKNLLYIDKRIVIIQSARCKWNLQFFYTWLEFSLLLTEKFMTLNMKCFELLFVTSKISIPLLLLSSYSKSIYCFRGLFIYPLNTDMTYNLPILNGYSILKTRWKICIPSKDENIITILLVRITI